MTSVPRKESSWKKPIYVFRYFPVRVVSAPGAQRIGLKCRQISIFCYCLCLDSSHDEAHGRSPHNAD